MQVHLLSGQVNSGKTTYLMEYVKQNKNCFGILSPVINNKRHFYCIASQETKLMEATDDETEVWETGKYRFSVPAFHWAIQRLEQSLNYEPEFLIIDEIGPLELKGKGFAEILKRVLKENSKVSNLLVVVRESAVKQVVDYFEMQEMNINRWNRAAR